MLLMAFVQHYSFLFTVPFMSCQIRSECLQCTLMVPLHYVSHHTDHTWYVLENLIQYNVPVLCFMVRLTTTAQAFVLMVSSDFQVGPQYEC